MKHGFIKLALSDALISLGDPDANRKEIEAAAAAAAKEGAEIVIFGGQSLTGSTTLSMTNHRQILNAAAINLEKLIGFSNSCDPVLIVSLPLDAGNRVVSVAAVIHSGKLICLIPEKETGSGAVALFGAEYQLSRSRLIKIENFGFSFGIVFGDDFGRITPHAQELVAGGADMVVNLAAAPALIESHRNRENAIRETSKRLKCAYVYVSAGRGESVAEAVYSGDKIVAECGKILLSAEGDDSGVLYAEIDTDAVKNDKPQINGGFYAALPFIPIKIKSSGAELLRTAGRLPFVPAAGEFDRIFDIAARGIITRMRTISVKKVILGLSGGLDSTMSLLLCEKTYKKYNLPLKDVICVTMPTENSSKRTKENAAKLISLLGVTGINIPIDEAVNGRLKAIGHACKTDTVYENAQARERAQILLNLSNKFNALMIGTGDLSEAALGWSTYGGDSLAHYNPNSSLPKTLIRAIVRSCCLTTSDSALAGVLNSVLSTPISPELLKNQDTEKSIGAYELHDFFLYNLIGKGRTAAKTYYLAARTFFDYDKKEILNTLRTFVTRFFKNQFKRSASCDGIKLSEYDLSGIKISSEFNGAAYIREIEKLESELSGD
jgi:NAD+ synthase (glutamine-hydrolysing)